jgi:hypothetical protein
MVLSAHDHVIAPLQGRWRPYVCTIPAVAALSYPVALLALNRSFGLVGSAHEPGEWLLGAVTVGGSLILCYGVPVVGFVIAYQLGWSADRSLSRVGRITAHLAVASPPLFTLIGVAFYIAGVTNGDYVLWAIIWIGAAILIFTRSQANEAAERESHRVLSPALRTAHGISAVIILAIFLAPHIANHLTAIWNVDVHKMVLQTLRHVYRTDTVQPLLVTLFIFQIASGLALWGVRMRVKADLFATLQTTAGIYLALYIVSHIIAVFVLGRMVMKVDTDFLFASGAPTGLLHDAWNVRLIPHYSLAVWALFIHLACGLRGALLSHGVSITTASTVAWPIIGVGAAVAATIILSMCGLHVSPWIIP